jgi:hypothetical protein
MLFSYSPNSLAENWLNSTIVEVLGAGMQTILAGGQAPAWAEALPIEHKTELRGRSGIRKRVQKLWTKFAALNHNDQLALLEALTQQTSLPNIYFNDAVCRGIDVFEESVRDAAVDLFRFVFEEQLTSIKVGGESLRDIHYAAIYAEFPSRICPFCGIGHFRAPGAPRHALDHYMPISKYPFAGGDFRNLPPMCSECNSDFKKNTDILFDPNGQRQRCVDPYDGPRFVISLAQSVPFGGAIMSGISLPQWVIDFRGGPQEQAENWDRIFKVRERYERDVLNAEFRSWLEHFALWYTRGNHGGPIGDDIADSIPEYLITVIQDGLADKAFLKAEVFRLLCSECAHPLRGSDMKAFLEILISCI